jgi:hypothetical protein
MTAKMQYFSKSGRGFDTPEEAKEIDDRCVTSEQIRLLEVWTNQLRENLHNRVPGVVTVENAIARVRNIWGEADEVAPPAPPPPPPDPKGK